MDHLQSDDDSFNIQKLDNCRVPSKSFKCNYEDSSCIDLTEFTPSKNNFKKDEIIVIDDSVPSGATNYDSSNIFLNEPLTKKAKRKFGDFECLSDSDYELPIAERQGGRSKRGGIRAKSKMKTTNSKGRGRARRSAKACEDDRDKSPIPIPQPARRGRSRGSSGLCDNLYLDYSPIDTPTPAKRRGRGRGTAPSVPQRGRSRGRGRQKNTNSAPITSISIGNTHEYPDSAENQPIFSNKPLEFEPDLNDSLGNEELSVKVYWQSSEVVKFNIRMMQKLTQIFDHFSSRENVSKNKLLFTYDNKILKPDDTPESINYNIVKFIQGGVVNNSLDIKSEPAKTVLSGFIVKFQCQSQKKPFETSISKDEKLQIAMMRCAEHFELPLNKIRFEFDGDIVKGHMTPADLDMESGDCIDVKILK